MLPDDSIEVMTSYKGKETRAQRKQRLHPNSRMTRKQQGQVGPKGKGIVKTDHKFHDQRANTNEIPIWKKSVSFKRETVDSPWIQKGYPSRINIGYGTYAKQVSKANLDEIRDDGNEVRATVGKDGKVKKVEIISPDRLLYTIREYREATDADLKSFNKKKKAPAAPKKTRSTVIRKTRR